jgi:hemoglobin/transferrin/lactoferrin receptor protein
VDESRLKSRFGSQDREVQEERVTVASASLDIDRVIRRWQTAYGIQWSSNTVGSNAWMERRADGLRLDTPALTRYPNGGSNMGSLAAYASGSRRWNHWSLKCAGRYNRGWLGADFLPQSGLELPFNQVSYNRGALTGSTTLRWSPISRMGLHSSLSTAFRNPNVDDVGKVRAKDGFAVLPADDLKPERLLSAELGGHWRSANGRWSAMASGFLTGLRDAIVPVDTALTSSSGATISTIVVEGDTNMIQVNANIGRATISGSQWEVQHRLESGWWPISPGDKLPMTGHLCPTFPPCLVGFPPNVPGSG